MVELSRPALKLSALSWGRPRYLAAAKLRACAVRAHRGGRAQGSGRSCSGSGVCREAVGTQGYPAGYQDVLTLKTEPKR